MHLLLVEVVGPWEKEVCCSIRFECFLRSQQECQIFTILLKSNAFSSKLRYSIAQLKTEEKIEACVWDGFVTQRVKF